MTWLIYALAALGAYRIVRRTIIVIRAIWCDLKAKPTGGSLLKPLGRFPLNGH